MRILRILMLFFLTISLAFLCSAFMVDNARGEKLYGVYDGNWRLTYYMTGDAAYDTQWSLQYYIRNNTLYDKNWHRRYFIKGAKSTMSISTFSIESKSIRLMSRHEQYKMEEAWCGVSIVDFL